MDHLTVSGINTDMGYRIAGIICTREKDNVSGSRFRCADMLALVINALRRGTWQIVISAVSYHITHKA